MASTTGVTPKAQFVHLSHWRRVYDVEWAGGALTLPNAVDTPRASEPLYQAQVFASGVDISSSAALSASPTRLMNNHRQAGGVWGAGTGQGTVVSAGPLQLMEVLTDTSVNVAADYQQLPAGMTISSGGGGGGGTVGALTTDTIKRLRKTGMGVRETETLSAALADPTTVDWETALRRGDLSWRQMQTLNKLPTQTTGKSDLSFLLRGGFTRQQAKLILGV